MALYIVKFRDNFWPQGILAEASEERELYTKMRTRVLAKTKLNGTIPGKRSLFYYGVAFELSTASHQVNAWVGDFKSGINLSFFKD